MGVFLDIGINRYALACLEGCEVIELSFDGLGTMSDHESYASKLRYLFFGQMGQGVGFLGC